MTILTRAERLREPPILLQILVLLVGGLIVAQLVTLLLTLVFPPAPPAQHSLDDIAAALRGETHTERTGGKLARATQSGPPDVGGPGWLTLDPPRHTLAALLGAGDGDVRLAFYSPLPFAGITAPPTRPPIPVHPASFMAPRSRPRLTIAGLLPVGLLLADQPAPPGGGLGGGFGGGFPGSAGRFPSGDGFPGERSDRGHPGGGPGRRPDGSQPHAEDTLRQDQRSPAPPPSSADLDRQPTAPSREDSRPAFRPEADHAHVGPETPLRLTLPSEPPREVSPAPESEAPVAAEPPVASRATPPRETATAAPQFASQIAPATTDTGALFHTAPAATPARDATARPLPIAPRPRALFGLAPAPFVEGDFVAALRRPDGRWIVVQPAPQSFPNAWQQRVILWFVIAFAIVAPLGWLFARHIVRPLARFTDAAEQLGRDPSAALVALEGPAEIGRAAHAFNVMLNRLRSFVDDRTAMVGAISHDLRTPLTRLRFRIEEVDDEDVRDGMTQEVEEMEAMITSVLSFIRDASTPGARERLDLGLLIEDVAEDASMVGGDVTVERGGSAPVEVDVLGMRRLLANLIENAVKYGDRARIRLSVDEDDAVAAVIDDGPGIPEAELERAFEPFYRASNAAASGKTGTGLGLAVCRSIARAHGGDVRLVRRADGFTAELRLPLAYDARIAA
ncbi:MAG: HAMP domain-containing protein [Sphingomonadaceae bacterium]|nr:HAMP domain-containing protein [Sphingomonadaceae bacterium]